MRIQTIIYVTDMETAVDWYARVLGVAPVVHGTHWSSFRVGEADLALHWTDQLDGPGRVEVSLVTTEPLEELIGRWLPLGLEPEGGIIEEGFGRSLALRDPSGMRVQVNEHDPARYGG